jgi:serine/threonine-protein phosphatase 2B catalytic subunit
LYPKRIALLRGNHESRQLTSYFNFKDECINKYDESIYDKFIESFDTLPLGCILNNKFLAIHAGISPELQTVNIIT